MPEDYAGLILIGGMSWFSPEAELIVPLVERTIKEKKLVASTDKVLLIIPSEFKRLKGRASMIAIYSYWSVKAV